MMYFTGNCNVNSNKKEDCIATRNDQLTQQECESIGCCWEEDGTTTYCFMPKGKYMFIV